jgi:DNA-binding NarL/FixJ family response regulator
MRSCSTTATRRAPESLTETRASHNVRRPRACNDVVVRPTVLIVDDHADFRTAARALLEAEGFPVVGEAADGAEALQAVVSLRPSVVLLDVQLPDLDGFAVAEQIAAAPNSPAVVLVSSRDGAAYGSRLQQTPARGFIAKSELSGAALAGLLA